MPVCTLCRVERPLERFVMRPSGSRRKDCKECAKERSNRRYQEKREEIRTAVRLQNAANPAKNRARANAWAKAHPEIVNQRNKEARKRHPDKAIARWKVTNAVQSGALIKGPCSKCNRPPDRHVHGHHHNGYDEAHWFDVVWLCRWCHEKEHHQLV